MLTWKSQENYHSVAVIILHVPPVTYSIPAIVNYSVSSIITIKIIQQRCRLTWQLEHTVRTNMSLCPILYHSCIYAYNIIFRKL